MSTQDDLSSMSLPSPSAASVANKIEKVVVFVNKSHKYDQLGSRSSEATQLEIASDRKKCQGCCTIEKEQRFVSLLENLRTKA